MPVDDQATKDALDRIALRVQEAAQRVASRGGLIVQRREQNRLTSGYGVVSGTMRRSIHVEGPEGLGAGTYRARVGPSVIYARRFDLGFFSTDSLGRVYAKRGAQPPGLLGSIARPFVKPAYRESVPLIRDLAKSEYEAAIRG